MNFKTAIKSLGGLSSAIFAAVGLVSALLVIAATYQYALFARVESAISQPRALDQVKSRQLDEVRAALGHGGFLQALTLFAETGKPEARADMAAQLEAADKGLRAYQALQLSPAESALAADLRMVQERYKTAMAASDKPAAFAGPAGLALSLQHAAVADRVAELRRTEAMAAADQLARITTGGFVLGVGAVLFALLVVAGLVWIVRARVIGPLHEVRNSLTALSRGDWRTPVWGTARPDEIGDLARVVDAFRTEAASVPDVSLLTGRGRQRFKFDGESEDLFSELAENIQGTAHKLSESNQATVRLVESARDDLTNAISQVQQLCTAIARSASDSNQQIRQSTEILSRAAAQVRSFDDNGSTGGLDAIVAALRKHSESIADTLAGVGEESSRILARLTGSEGEFRNAAADARDTMKDLAETTGQVQDRLISAVQLLRASGELLSSTATDADKKLSQAVTAVTHADRTLHAVATNATNNLDSVHNKVTRTLDELNIRTRDAGSQLEAALGYLRRGGTMFEGEAEALRHRFAPLLADLEGVHGNLSDAVGQAAERIDRLTPVVGALRELNGSLIAELERRQADPNLVEQITELLGRLDGIAASLGERVSNVGETAERLGQMLDQSLTGSVEEVRRSTALLQDQTRAAAEEVRHSAAELQTQGRAANEDLQRGVAEMQNQSQLLASDAANATNALNFAATKQEVAAESLRTVVMQLLPAASNNAATTTELARTVTAMAERLSAIDRTATSLAQATDGVHRLLQGAPAAQTAAGNDLSRRLAEIAEQLRNTGAVQAAPQYAPPPYPPQPAYPQQPTYAPPPQYQPQMAPQMAPGMPGQMMPGQLMMPGQMAPQMPGQMMPQMPGQMMPQMAPSMIPGQPMMQPQMAPPMPQQMPQPMPQQPAPMQAPAPVMPNPATPASSMESKIVPLPPGGIVEGNR